MNWEWFRKMQQREAEERSSAYQPIRITVDASEVFEAVLQVLREQVGDDLMDQVEAALAGKEEDGHQSDKGGLS